MIHNLDAMVERAKTRKVCPNCGGMGDSAPKEGENWSERLARQAIKTAPGQQWELPCPFFKEEDPTSEFRWRPGKYETSYGESRDGMGHEVRSVVAIADLPKPHQARVFYKRSWVAPDGYTFGSGRLKCIALPAFNAWRNNGTSWNSRWVEGGATLVCPTCSGKGYLEDAVVKAAQQAAE